MAYLTYLEESEIKLRMKLNISVAHNICRNADNKSTYLNYSDFQNCYIISKEVEADRILISMFKCK